MKRSVSEKYLTRKQKKKNMSGENHQIKTRFLISVNFLGSAGPIRFLANDKDSVSGVIDTALKLYNKEGRLPILGSHGHNFLLYPANAGLDALNPLELIGSIEGRTFVLSKKQTQPLTTEARSEVIARKRSGGWKAWLSNSLSFKISSH